MDQLSNPQLNLIAANGLASYLPYAASVSYSSSFTPKSRRFFSW